VFADRGILSGAKRLSAIVIEREKDLDQVHRGLPVQKRSIPNMKTSATVTAAESISDPRQPRRFEKKNMFCRTLRCKVDKSS
jgi:hypothetical protein